jgi:hypothetical protein
MTGMPPPPAQMMTFPLFTKVEITSFSSISIGSGEGTTLLYPLPASSKIIN